MSPIACRRRCATALALALALAAVGCRKGRTDDGSLLDRIPDDAGVVVMVRPPELADTWAGSLATALARRAEVPDCVVARAKTASRVVIAWSHMLPEDGWLIAIAGGATEPPCPELASRGAVATWSRGLAPRAGDTRGFFDDRARRARWAALASAPLRGLAEHELSAGIIAHADFTLDPRDGVDGRALVRFDSPAAAEGVRGRFERWHADLDRDRMGGAWPAAAALAVQGPRLGDAALAITLRLAGEAGATSAPLLATALALGADRTDRAPCPLASVTEPWHITCAGGELQVPRAVRDALIASAPVHFAGDRIAITTSAGQVAGLRLTAVGASSPLLALGLREGDLVKTVDGETVGSTEQLVARARAAELGRTVTVELVRAGRARTLRFELSSTPVPAATRPHRQ